jgi:hypothetical protein
LFISKEKNTSGETSEVKRKRTSHEVLFIAIVDYYLGHCCLE